jgi:hypothetical protein
VGDIGGTHSFGDGDDGGLSDCGIATETPVIVVELHNHRAWVVETGKVFGGGDRGDGQVGEGIP